MTVKRLLAGLILAVITSVGCEQKEQPRVAQPKQHYQRFIPVPREPSNVNILLLPWSGFFALDSKTGRLCRTYHMQTNDDWNNIPSCFDLFQEYPD